MIINYTSHSWTLTPFLKRNLSGPFLPSGIPPYFKEMTNDQMQYFEKQGNFETK